MDWYKCGSPKIYLKKAKIRNVQTCKKHTKKLIASFIPFSIRARRMPQGQIPGHSCKPPKLDLHLGRWCESGFGRSVHYSKRNDFCHKYGSEFLDAFPIHSRWNIDKKHKRLLNCVPWSYLFFVIDSVILFAPALISSRVLFICGGKFYNYTICSARTAALHLHWSNSRLISVHI
jgi:hypothetical protein